MTSGNLVDTIRNSTREHWGDTVMWFLFTVLVSLLPVLKRMAGKPSLFTVLDGQVFLKPKQAQNEEGVCPDRRKPGLWLWMNSDTVGMSCH